MGPLKAGKHGEYSVRASRSHWDKHFFFTIFFTNFDAIQVGNGALEPAWKASSFYTSVSLSVKWEWNNSSGDHCDWEWNVIDVPKSLQTIGTRGLSPESHPTAMQHWPCLQEPESQLPHHGATVTVWIRETLRISWLVACKLTSKLGINWKPPNCWPEHSCFSEEPVSHGLGGFETL